MGCLDCKRVLIRHVQDMVGPIRDRRAELLKRPETIRAILAAGSDRARVIAQATMDEVRARVGVVLG